MSIPFPEISPVAFEIGPLVIRWYALAYLGGFLLGWAYALRLATRLADPAITRARIDDFIAWVILGVIAGGRLGYVIFYQPDYYWAHPLETLYLWHGGMSFHGGAMGVIIAIIAYARVYRINMFRLADIVCACVPIGLGLGRVANFINAELYGRVTSMPWAVIFPGSDGQPRHPSQVYQAVGEGLILFVVLAVLMRTRFAMARPGLVSAVFLAGYAAARFVIEFFREPDAHLGTLSFGLTMGQTLCIPMVLGALLVIAIARRDWRRD
jgi:phosphatidylglycerol:prolipoprotein diacylglycerol transferase